MSAVGRVPLPPLWVAAVAGTVAALVYLALFLRIVLSSEFVDFEAYYSSAWALRQGEPLYQRALLWRDAGYTHALSPGPEAPEGKAFLYQPGFAIAFLPLTFLPYRTAAILWFVFTSGCLVATAYVLTRLLLPVPPAYTAAVTLVLSALASLFQPMRASQLVGQIDAVLLLLMALTLAAFVARHDARAGVWLALAVGVKPILALFVLLFLWKRAYRAAVVSVVLMAVFYLAPVAVVGLGPVWEFIAVGQYWTSSHYASSVNNQSPYGMLLRLLTENRYTVPILDAPILVPALRALVVVGTLFILLASITRSRAMPAYQHGLEFGLVIAAMLLISPLSEDIHYTYLLLPLVAVGAALAISGRWRPTTVALAAALVAIYAYLSLPGLNAAAFAFYAFYDGPVPPPKSLLTGAHLYALLAMTGLAVATIRLVRVRTLDADPGGRVSLSDG